MTDGAVQPVKGTPGLGRLGLAIVFGFVVLAGAITFGRSTTAEAAATNYFPSHLIEQNLEYARQRWMLFWGSTLAQLIFLLALAFTSLARRLADGCSRICRGW